MIGPLKRPLSICQSNKTKFKMHFSCSLNLLGVDNKDVSAALQMLLTELKLRLQHRLFLV